MLRLTLVVIFALSGGLGLSSLWYEGPTLDEPVYLIAGTAYLKAGRFDLNPEHPPFWKEAAGFPLLFLGLDDGPLNPWNPAHRWSAEAIFRLARIPIFFFFCITGWFVYSWSSEFWGPAGGLLSLFFYALCPNLLAHARLVTPDVPVTAFFFLSVYSFWRYCRQPTRERFACCAAATGLALACRFSALLLFPTYGLILAWLTVGKSKMEVLEHAQALKPWGPPWARFVVCPLFLALASLPVIALTYGFVGFGHYFRGLRKFIEHAAGSGHDAFLLGQYSKDGWWYYFLVAFALKTPLVTLGGLGILALAKRRAAESGTAARLFLWLPVILFLGAASLNKVNLGLRLILPVFPFLFVALGELSTLDLFKKGLGKAAALAGIGWYLAATCSVHPHYLGYFNELAGRHKGFHYLSDSNVDWGQDLPRLGIYLKEKGIDGVLLAYFGLAPPDYYGIRWQYLPSDDPPEDAMRRKIWEASGGYFHRGAPRLLAISVTLLKGVPFEDHRIYTWLEKRTPLARIGSSILVYDITADLEAGKRLISTYEGWGLEGLAEMERRLRERPE